jgi:hypothetical protein
LVNKKGKPVAAGNVRIELKEFLTPKDAAFNQLSTVSAGRLLESGGMFSIKGYVENEEVELKKGKQMQVEMPTIHLQPGMELFTAVKNEDGITEWAPASVPFIPKDSTPTIFAKLDTKYLRSLLLDIPAIEPESLQTSYAVPTLPKAPKELKSKPELVLPTKKTMFTWYQRLFVPWFILNKELKEESQRLEKVYAARLKRYNKRLASYEKAYAQYISDSTQFELTTLNTMRTWLLMQKKQYTQYVNYIESKQWNAAIGQLIYLSDKNKLTDQNPMSLFMYYLESKEQKDDWKNYIQAIYRIDFLLTQSMTKIAKEHAKNGILHTLVPNDYMWSFDFKNKLIEQQLVDNPKLASMLQMARQDIVRQTVKARQTIYPASYTTTLNDFGTFNCDRFKNLQPNQMATILIPFKGDAKVSFYVAGTNSYIYATKTEEGYSATLPKGLPIKAVLVVFTPKTGPQISILETLVTSNTTLHPELKNVSLDQLQKELASL